MKDAVHQNYSKIIAPLFPVECIPVKCPHWNYMFRVEESPHFSHRESKRRHGSQPVTEHLGLVVKDLPDKIDELSLSGIRRQSLVHEIVIDRNSILKKGFTCAEKLSLSWLIEMRQGCWRYFLNISHLVTLYVVTCALSVIRKCNMKSPMNPNRKCVSGAELLTIW